MVPILLRDALYRLFIDCLGSTDAVSMFERGADKLAAQFPGHEDYLRERTRRFKSVLRRRAAPTNLSEEIALAQSLFKNGLYFEAHEYLETAWKRSEGKLKTHLQGLIQLAAAPHKLELDPKAAAGARYLALRGFEKLEDL